MLKRTTLTVTSAFPTQMLRLTEDILSFVSTCGISEGIVFVISAHTTTGIIVNEGLSCVETDIQDLLTRLVPGDLPYTHAHFLPSYGATSNNAPGHLKSTLVGNHCAFPIAGGEMVRGSAQDIYLAEFDGPQRRQIFITAMGE